MANSLRGMGRNNAIRDQGTLTCPPGSYAFATSGQSGKSVDRVSGLTCRNIYTGAVSNATGNAFGGGGGKASTKPIDCGGDALTGFWFNSKNYVNLDGFGGVCRVPSCGGGSCGLSTRDVGLNGTACCGNDIGRNEHKIADGSHLVTSVTGAISNNNVVANFGYDTLNFDVMKGAVPGGRYEAWGAACCARNEGGAECQSARNGGLNCTDVMQNWCRQGDRIFSDPACTGGALDGTWARNQQLAWCQQGSNFNNDNCKAFCTASTGKSTDQKEKCNQLYSAKCSDPANKNLGICSCLWNWSEYPTEATELVDKIKSAPHEPQCYFAECQKSGYRKDLTSNLGCPGCIQSQTISVNNATANLKDISQSCNVTTNNTATNSAPSGGGSTVTPTPTPPTPTPSAPTPSPSTSTPPTPTPSTVTVSKSTSPLIFVGAGVGVFFLLTVVAIAATKE